MQKKKVLTIILTILVFLSAALISVANVFRIDDVALETNVVSTEANAEAERLREDLQAVYCGASSIFANEKAADEALANYPYFRVTKFSRAFPNKLVIEVTETPEVFAMQSGEQYYILSATGTILHIRKDPENRGDAAPNVLVTGVLPEGKVGEQVRGEGVSEFLEICEVMAARLNGIRSNLERAEVVPAGDGTRLRLYMREGVQISVRNPSVLTAEKAEAITKMYLEMEDEQRLTGQIYVIENVEGTKVMIDYRPND